VVATADRGLCGGFNSSIVREARRLVRKLTGDGKKVKILCVGRKGARPAAPRLQPLIVDTVEDVAKPRH
jgi:F-type H+-transporting ATPase subunit gamma